MKSMESIPAVGDWMGSKYKPEKAEAIGYDKVYACVCDYLIQL